MTSRDEQHTMEASTGNNNSSNNSSTAAADRQQATGGGTSSTSSAAVPSASSQILAEKQSYIENYDFPYCEESSKYEPLKKIGQGTFGEVFKARERQSHSKLVALKKVLMDNEKEGVSGADSHRIDGRTRALLIHFCFVWAVPDHGIARDSHSAIAEARERRQFDRDMPDQGDGVQSLSFDILLGIRFLRTRFGRPAVEYEFEI